MKIDQTYIDEEVVKPIMKRIKELENLIRSNDVTIRRKIGWMSDNIAKIPKKKR